MKLRFTYIVILLVLLGCKTSPTPTPYAHIQGQTMGTTYNITCSTQNAIELQEQIDALLVKVNAGVNHYLPNSLITQFNKSDKGMSFSLSKQEGQHFYNNITASRRIVKQTNANFDPTVGALVNYWGFGSTGKYNLTAIDSLKVDSLMQTVSFNRIILTKTDSTFQIAKSDSRVTLDFSAIAKGYGVDVIAEYFNEIGIDDYLIEIGGETRLAGSNPKGKQWTLAISEPKTTALKTEATKILSISDKSVATSGNYRNFYKVGNQIVGHTINPFTGFPEQSSLLSATIIHRECMYADAYATACMVMGLEQSLKFVNTYPEIGFLFIYSDDNGILQSVDSGDLTFLN